MLYFIAQIRDLCFRDLEEDFTLFCYFFPEAPFSCAGIWSSWTCVTAAGDAAHCFCICIYCCALLFNFVVLFLAQRRSDANEGWIIWVADKQTPATLRAEAGEGSRREVGSISPCCSGHPIRALTEGQQPGQGWVRAQGAQKPYTVRVGGESASTAGMPPKYPDYLYHTFPCAEVNMFSILEDLIFYYELVLQHPDVCSALYSAGRKMRSIRQIYLALNPDRVTNGRRSVTVSWLSSCLAVTAVLSCFYLS